MTKEEIYRDYLPDDSVFTEEEAKINKLKHIIFDTLTESERRIIILYTEHQSVRKVAKLLFISPSSAWLEIDRIKTKIKSIYYNDNTETTTD